MAGSGVASELYPHIEKRLVDRLLTHYGSIKTSFTRGDWEKTCLNAAKFVEAAIEISLIHIESKSAGKKSFETSFNDLMKHPKKTDVDKSLTHMIPTVAKGVYTLRNKRGVAHTGGVDPSFMDATCMTSSCDWILSEILRVYHVSGDKKVEDEIAALVKRRTPSIQAFGERTLVLKTGLSARLEILAILDYHYPSHISEAKLYEDVKGHSRDNIRSSLWNLEESRMIYREEGTVVLTDKGLQFVDSRSFRERLAMEDS